MKIVCIGRNYREHARELNNPLPTEPIIFMKPESAVVLPHNPLFYPNFTKDLHYEVELVIKISRLGKHIEQRFAHRYYSSIGVGIDFTARDVQEECKKKGLPWEKAKAFDGSAALGTSFVPLARMEDAANIKFGLRKNGEVVQEGQSKDMIFSFDEIIAYVSSIFTLKIGDLIFTGTPAGVGPVQIGDTLNAYIEKRELLRLNIR